MICKLHLFDFIEKNPNAIKLKFIKWLTQSAFVFTIAFILLNLINHLFDFISGV